jgi:iron complex transport system permease protein
MHSEIPALNRSEYSKYIWGKWAALFMLAVALFIMFLLSISVGSSGLSVMETLRTIFGNGSVSSRAIIWNVRMPRIATAISVGIALAMAGCVMQNVLRNPLASASTLGVSQGASFGAAFAIVNLGAGTQVNARAALTITNPYMVTLCAFLGGIATTAMIFGLSRVSGVTPSVMVLAGVAISSLFAGATALVQYFCDDVVVTTIVLDIRKSWPGGMGGDSSDIFSWRCRISLFSL